MEAFLEELDPAYKQYAQPLHTGSYTNVAEIAAATRELLHEAGVPKGPAGVILAAAQKKAGGPRGRHGSYHVGSRPAAGFRGTVAWADHDHLWEAAPYGNCVGS